MFSLLLIVAFGIYAIRALSRPVTVPEITFTTRLGDRLEKLWSIVHESIRDKKYLRAEKALLTILRVDERNATAYNRLGILYAKEHEFANAIECFEIAQSLEPSASSLHNVGLVYFETAQYEKARVAFEQAIQMEGNLAARYIAYAKVQEKLGNAKKMIEAVEKAVEIEPNPQSLTILADAYERSGEHQLAEDIRQKLQRMQKAAVPQRRIRQPRRVVM
ncbi:MAG TPA: tetratricopeptide repeat protein [Patescibacteria group bacterium]|nr:tetratricopeptide repeat protein [Patescibacteria group bacterium]